MGVDTRIYLKPNATAGQIADVIGILKGAKKTKINKGKSFESVNAEGSKVESIECCPTCCRIIFKGGAWMLHYESECKSILGARLLMPRSFAEAIAIGKRLVDIFGGYVEYQDYEDAIDYYNDLVKIFTLNDDNDFDLWQKFLWKLKPLTKKEIKDCKKFAAYD